MKKATTVIDATFDVRRRRRVVDAMTDPASMVAEARARAMRIAATLETTRGADSDAQRPRARNDVADPRASDLDDRAARWATIEVGALPALARRANLGAMGGYHPVDVVDESRPGTSTPTPPDAYLERRFDRFYRDVRGYDADERARLVLETASGRGAVDGGTSGTTRRSRVAEAAASGGGAPAGGTARAGLGSHRDDDDAYVKFRSSRSAAFHRSSAPAR